MPEPTHSNPIGLAELIQNVKQELLSTTAGKDGDAPVFFVDSVELEIQVVASRGSSGGGMKLDVVAVGGGEIGGTLSRQDVHTVKVSLSPLFEKERIMEFYQTLEQNPMSEIRTLAQLKPRHKTLRPSLRTCLAYRLGCSAFIRTTLNVVQASSLHKPEQARCLFYIGFAFSP